MAIWTITVKNFWNSWTEIIDKAEFELRIANLFSSHILLNNKIDILLIKSLFYLIISIKKFFFSDLTSIYSVTPKTFNALKVFLCFKISIFISNFPYSNIHSNGNKFEFLLNVQYVAIYLPYFGSLLGYESKTFSLKKNSNTQVSQSLLPPSFYLRSVKVTFQREISWKLSWQEFVFEELP